MAGQDKPVGERLATLEATIKGLVEDLGEWKEEFRCELREVKGNFDGALGEIKGLVNPRFRTIDELVEWRRLYERAEDARDKRISRKISIYFGIMTIIIAAINIAIACIK